MCLPKIPLKTLNVRFAETVIVQPISNHREYTAPADIRWQGSQPYSTQYDDIYFSADGNAEVQRVFMQPSNLVERARDAHWREPRGAQRDGPLW